MKTLMRNIQLVVSAIESERTSRQIAEHHLMEIVDARLALSMTKGTDVVTALHGLIQSGLPVQIDLHEIIYTDKPDKSLPPESRRGGFVPRG